MDDVKKQIEELMNQVIRSDGKCRPGRLSGCKTIITAGDVKAGILGLQHFQEQVIKYGLLVNAKNLPALADEQRLNILQMLLLPESMALIHWKAKDIVMFRTDAMAKVVAAGEFIIGGDYGALVKAVEATGFTALDIEFLQ